VDVTDGDLTFETLAGTTINQGHLTGAVETRRREQIVDVRLNRAVENGRCDRNTVLEVAAHFDEFTFLEGNDVFLVGLFAVNDFELAVQILAQLLAVAGICRRLHAVNNFTDLLAEGGRGPTQVRFENLTDVHTGRNAERVQHEVNGRAV